MKSNENDERKRAQKRHDGIDTRFMCHFYLIKIYDWDRKQIQVVYLRKWNKEIQLIFYDKNLACQSASFHKQQTGNKTLIDHTNEKIMRECFHHTIGKFNFSSSDFPFLNYCDNNHLLSNGIEQHTHALKTFEEKLFMCI